MQGAAKLEGMQSLFRVCSWSMNAVLRPGFSSVSSPQPASFASPKSPKTYRWFGALLRHGTPNHLGTRPGLRHSEVGGSAVFFCISDGCSEPREHRIGFVRKDLGYRLWRASDTPSHSPSGVWLTNRPIHLMWDISRRSVNPGDPDVARRQRVIARTRTRLAPRGNHAHR